MEPSCDRASLVFAASLKYSNGVAVLNQSVPGVSFGQGCMFSSSTCSSPSRTLPTVPRCASHCSLSQAANPRPSVAPVILVNDRSPPCDHLLFHLDRTRRGGVDYHLERRQIVTWPRAVGQFQHAREHRRH